MFLFEQDCFVSGEPNSVDPNSPGAIYESRSLFEGEAQTYGHETALVKRGTSRLFRVCANVGKSAVSNNLKSQPYPSVSILRNTKNFINQAAPLGCAAAGLVVDKVKNLNTKYVVEHVMELSSPKKFAQSMVDGVLPGVGKLSTGKLPYTGVFDAKGVFQQTFAQLKIPSTGVGNTPEEAIFSVLGTNSDFNNMLIFDDKINTLKKIVRRGLPFQYVRDEC